MFDIFDQVAPAAEKTKAEVYESGFTAPPSLRAEVMNESRLLPSHHKIFPVLFGGCVGVAFFTLFQSAFPLLLIASLVSLYRR